MYENSIIHRDLNVNNVMLHFPDLEPSPKHLKDPRIFAKLKKKVQARI